jgi:NitT/TauT family transport system substrate-binding protein
MRIAHVGAVLVAMLVACTSAAQPSPTAVPASVASASGPGAAAPAKPADGAAPAPASPAAPLPAKKMTLAAPGVSLNYLTHQIGLVKGFYREAGFDVEFQIMQANSGLAGITSGEIAFGDWTGSAIRAASRGLPIRMVECHGVRPIYHIALAAGLQSAGELEGQSVGINVPGTDTHVIGRDLIRKYGGDPSKVDFLAVGGSNVRYAALESGRVAGAVLSLTETVLAREAGLTVIGTAEDMPLICDSGVVVTVGAIAERPQEIRAFIRAVQRAVQFMQADRAESVRILAEWSQVDERQAAIAYDLANVQVSYSTDKVAGQRAIEQAILYSKEAGDVDPSIQFDDIADVSLYP